MRRIFLGFGLLVLLAPPAGAQALKGPIKLGIVGPFSGRSAEAGERVATAVRMAVDEQNAAGGLLGVKIELVIGDDEGVPEKSTLVASSNFSVTANLRPGRP